MKRMTGNKKDAERFARFGDFSFDRESDELYRGKERIDIQPQPGRLLALFLSKPGRLLSQEEITEEMWPDSVVEFEQRIRSAVRDIRTALGDDPEHPQYIETVSRRGYRFIFPLQAENAPSRIGSFAKLAALGILLVLGLHYFDRLGPISEDAEATSRMAGPVLAILPVRDLSNGTGQRFPVDGLTHELIAHVARIAPERLAVIGRTSAMKFRDTQLSIGEISQALGADYLLETTLTELGGDLRVTTTLVEVSSGQVVWSSGFKGRIGELQGFEIEVALGIGRALSLEGSLSGFEKNLRLSTRPEAYDAYLTGLYLLGRSPEERAESHTFFSRAVELDPEFAPAYLGLARSGSAAKRPAGERREAIATALRLDETLGDAYYMRAWDRFINEWDWDSAAADFETAIRLDPGRIEIRELHAAFLRAAGQFDRALEEAERALAIDPLSELVYRDMSWLYIATGRFEQAIELCRRGLSLGLKGPVNDHNCLMLTYLLQGEMEKAAGHALEIMALESADAGLTGPLTVEAPEELFAAFWTWQLEKTLDDPENNGGFFNLARLYTRLERQDEALTALQKGLERHEFGMVFILGDPAFIPLRGNPKFQEIARAVGIPAALG
ncbi:MAG: winged helix-turn-helix domain-containing protein [Sphingomonadales bacterium]